MTACVHRWLIDSPQGPTSWGECKHCHARREFSNFAADEAQKTISGRGNQASRAKSIQIVHKPWDYGVYSEIGRES